MKLGEERETHSRQTVGGRQVSTGFCELRKKTAVTLSPVMNFSSRTEQELNCVITVD